MKKCITWLVPLALAAMVFGCATDRPTSSTKRAGVGGAAAGAAIGGVIGHQSGRALEGAAIGGAIGAASGAVLGSAHDEDKP